MKKKVGIPRSLFYYKFYPLWKTFFEEIGAEIVVSDRTNKHILDQGVKSCVDEACLPVKLFHGHVINLKGKADFIFIPRFTSISKGEYICPKFGGLPDMIRNTLKDLPVIIDTEINLRNSGKNSIRAAVEIGSFFDVSRKHIKNSYYKALKSYYEYKKGLKKGLLPGESAEADGTEGLKKGLLPGESAEADGTEGKKPADKPERLKIVVVGHVYNLYDDFINMNLLEKLKCNEVEIITADMVEGYIIDTKCAQLPKKIFWYFGRKAIGTVLHFIDSGNIDGIIYLMSFGCGIDSFICDLAMRKTRRSSEIPFMILTLDEHSGEAGINTRIEAFIDMIKIKSNKTSIKANNNLADVE